MAAPDTVILFDFSRRVVSCLPLTGTIVPAPPAAQRAPDVRVSERSGSLSPRPA